MTRHPIETAAGEAFAPEPEPIEGSPYAWRIIMWLLVILVVGIGAMAWAVFL